MQLSLVDGTMERVAMADGARRLFAELCVW